MTPQRQAARGRAFGFRFLFRLAGWSVSAAVALVVLLYLAMPAMLRYGVPHLLARYGVVSSVEGARVGLANERVTLTGFQVGAGDGPNIRWGEVTARVDLSELLKGNIRIIDFQVKDARVDVARLAESHWKPPQRLAAIPLPVSPIIEIGEVMLEDLTLTGLSQRIGRRVALKIVSVGSLSHLAAGDQVAFRVDALVGDAGVNAVGRVRMVDDLPVLEGRYKIGALNLEGLERLPGLKTQGALKGQLDADGTFRLAYAQGDGEVRAELSGRAGLVNVEYRRDDGQGTRGSGEWDGAVDLRWPVAGGPPGIEARGRVSEGHLEVERVLAGMPLAVTARGLEWHGELRAGGAFGVDGSLEGEGLEIEAGPATEKLIRIESTGLQAQWTQRSGGAGRGLTVERVSAGATRISSGDGFNMMVFDALADDVTAGESGYLIRRFEASSAESASGGVVERLVGVEAETVQGEGLSGVRAASLQVRRTKLRLHNDVITAEGARAESAKLAAPLSLSADRLQVASVSHERNGIETWGSGIRLFGVRAGPGGEVSVNNASAGRLNQFRSGEPAWALQSLSAAGLSARQERIFAGQLTVGSISVGRAGSEVLDAGGTEAASVLFRPGEGAEAEMLSFEAASYRGPESASLELEQGEIASPSLTAGGEFRARFLEAERARRTDAAGGVSRIRALHLGGLSGRIDRGARIDAVRFASVDHEGGAGQRIHAEALDFSQVELSPRGDAAAGVGGADRFDLTRADGTRLRLDQLALSAPRFEAGSGVSARSGQARALTLGNSQGTLLHFYGLAAEALEPVAGGGHRLDSLTARALEQPGSSRDGALEIGPLSARTLTLSAAGRLSAGRLDLKSVRIGDADDARRPSLTVDRIVLDSPRYDPAGSVHLGRVSVEGATAVAGLDSNGRFLSPLPPVTGGGRLTLDRAATSETASVGFFDRSVTPPFEIRAKAISFEIDNGTGADRERPARFNAAGSFDEFSSFDASGSFALKPAGPDVNVTGRVTGFDLARLDTYAARHSGRAIQSGRGDAEFDVAVDRGELSGTIRFVFSRVKFEAGGPAPAADGPEASRLTLPQAVAMLADKNGLVRLTVPVSGSLDDPRFDFSDVLIQSLVKSVRSAVTLTFKPLGLLVSATGLLTSPDGLEFTPVTFDAGKKILSGRGLGYLDTLAKRLEDHPGVNIRICGRAVPADRISIEERRAGSAGESADPARQDKTGTAGVDALLAELARQRAETVRRYLDQEKAITAARLLKCESEVETTPGRLPRVDLPVRVETRRDPAPVSGKPG